MELFYGVFSSFLSGDVFCVSNTRDFLCDKGAYLKITDLTTDVNTIYYKRNNAFNLDWLGYFPNTTFIDCSNNQITSVDFLKLTQIKNLIMRHNPICILPDLSSYTSLVELDLSYCLLTTLVIDSMPNLETLRCKSNKIELVQLNNLPELKTLDLHDNNVTKIHGLNELSALVFLCCTANKHISLDNIIYCYKLQFVVCDPHFIEKLDYLCRVRKFRVNLYEDRVVFVHPVHPVH